MATFIFNTGAVVLLRTWNMNNILNGFEHPIYDLEQTHCKWCGKLCQVTYPEGFSICYIAMVFQTLTSKK